MLFLWSFFLVRGQLSNAVHYSVNEGLPSANVYDMLEDSWGYMWFATENGVSRFNGYQFENFTTEDGLPTNSILRLYEDNQGRIWFLSYQGTISYFEKGTVKSDTINAYLESINISFFSDIYIDSTGTRWLSPFNGGLLKLAHQKPPEWIRKRDIGKDSIYLYLDIQRDGYILCYYNIDGKDTLAGKEFYFKDNTWVFPFRLTRTAYHRGFHRRDSGFIIYYDKQLISVKNDQIQFRKTFDQEIVTVSSDQENNLWIGEKFNGVYQYRGEDYEAPARHYLPGLTVSNVIQDREGNHWFSTTEDGVFFIPSLEVRVYDNSNSVLHNNTILSMDMDQQQFFVSTEGKEIYRGRISGNRLTSMERLAISDITVDNVYSILFSPPSTLYATANKQQDADYRFEPIVLNDLLIYPLRYGYHLKKISNGNIVMAHANGMRIIQDKEIIYQTPDDFNVRIFVTEESPGGGLWLGTLNGLMLYENDQFLAQFSEDDVLGSRISELIYDNGKLWIGSFDHGLAILTGDSLIYLDKKDGLLSRRIKCIFAENDSTIWIGTNRGLNRILIHNEPFRIKRIDCMDIWDGLPSNEVNDIHQSGKFLWLATDKGLAALDPDRIRFNQPPPPVYLNPIVLDDQTVIPVDEPVSLHHYQNNLSFDFHGVTFKNPTSTQYFYRLLGLSKQWSSTNNTSVRFHKLDPGKYTLELYALNRSGQRSETVTLPFRIQKHYTQTNLFVIAVILVVLMITAGIVLYFYNAQRARIKLQRGIYLSEQKAMLAQMNPHFIFNALNSIQDFILDSDEKNANAYLVLFSSLIRKVLEASNKNYISLSEEMEMVELYLQLEKFRFEGKFDYTIQVSKEVNPEHIMIPSMVLQPYLENAIWHGLVPKNREGLLEMSIQKNNSEGTVITIADNGIGREKAGWISQQRKQHTPMGMKNVQERIRLLNKLNRTNMTVRVIDLYGPEKQSAGTKVVLNIPEN